MSETVPDIVSEGPVSRSRRLLPTVPVKTMAGCVWTLLVTLRRQTRGTPIIVGIKFNRNFRKVGDPETLLGLSL